MMSTTGRRPVIAAPTPTPVKPASEMGVSTTRSLPNSSTRPDRTLKGVPASATSSPRMQTVSSRRISSTRASRMACAKVNSRPSCPGRRFSGIHVLGYFIHCRIRRCDGEVHGLLHLRFQFGLHLSEGSGVGEVLIDQPLSKIHDRIALYLPCLFFLFRAVVLAVNVVPVLYGV